MVKKKSLTPGQIIRLFGTLLAIFLASGGFLYWQGFLQEMGLVLIGVIVLVVAILFVFGIRIAQKDGFLDGYVRAKDDFDKKRK